MVVCAVALCALPASASAALRKATGKTSQGKRALAHIREDNSVALVKLYYAADCRKPTFKYSAGIYFRDVPDAPFQRQGDAFSDGGPLKRKLSKGRYAKLVGQMTGAPSAAGGWEGTLQITVRVYNRKDKQIDACKTGQLSWKVALPG
jgi:hypothetical protein